MTTNATVEARHKDEAAKASNWGCYAHVPETPYFLQTAILAHAQALANLEAARAENADLTNRLAGIDAIARGADLLRPLVETVLEVAALASGHTPSPCPGCAAKDEAMAEIASECGKPGWGAQQLADAILAIVKPFIPPADPLAEALKAVLEAWHSNELEVSGHEAEFFEALAELKSRLGGA